MQAVLQRVRQASVVVDQQTVGEIGQGWLVLVGIANQDDVTDIEYIANKISGLRCFSDQEGKMNLSLADIKGELLVVSQFTLLADCRKGRRPSFVNAAPPEKANELYRKLIEVLKKSTPIVKEGVFQADMQVSLINDGPVTIILNSREARV